MFEVIDADRTHVATVWAPPSLGAVPSASANTVGALDAMAKAAQEEGYAQGHSEGFQAGMQQAHQVVERLNGLIAHLSRPLAELDLEVEHALTQLAVQVARKLVNEDLQLHPEHVAGAVHQALAALAATPRELKIHVHPEDIAVLRETLNAPTESHWKLIADSGLTRGDCRVVTESGQVDGRLDTRQANITNALLGVQA